MRKITCCLLPLFCLIFALSGSVMGQLITQSEAQRIGMTRLWYSQVQMDASRSKVKYMLLDRGTLFVSTDTGQLQAINAETGAVLWKLQVGRRDLPTLQMDASDHYVATVNGTTAYVYNRYNGKLLWKTDLEDAPGAGPAVSKSRLYIPGLKGRVQSYPLELVGDPLKEMGRDEKTLSKEDRERLDQERKESIRISDQYVEPLNVQALGRIFIQPVITREDPETDVDYIAWPTDNGDLNVATLNTFVCDYFPIKYLIETGKDISSRPCVLEYDPKDKKRVTGKIYVASRDGYVYCVRESDGDQQWEYPCSEPIIEQIAVIAYKKTEMVNNKKTTVVAGYVYVPTFVSGIFSLDAMTGEKNWWTPGIKKFLSQSNNRIYCVDHQSNLTVLDLQSGQQLGAIALKKNKFQYVNEITDRVYLATETGLIQCLRQIDQDAPIYHKQNPEADTKRQIETDDKPKNKAKEADQDEGEGNEEEAAAEAADLFGDTESEEDASDEGMDDSGDDLFGNADEKAEDADAGDDSADMDAEDAAADDDPFGSAAEKAEDADADDDSADMDAEDADAGDADAGDDVFGGGDIL